MTNEEKYLKSRIGEHTPFKVPDGYFDSLAVEVMQRLPQTVPSQQPVTQPVVTTVAKMRPWLYAAACLLVAVLTATAFFMRPGPTEQVAVVATVPASSESYIDEAADYVMADNIDIYACLSSEY